MEGGISRGGRGEKRRRNLGVGILTVNSKVELSHGRMQVNRNWLIEVTRAT